MSVFPLSLSPVSPQAPVAPAVDPKPVDNRAQPVSIKAAPVETPPSAPIAAPEATADAQGARDLRSDDSQFAPTSTAESVVKAQEASPSPEAEARAEAAAFDAAQEAYVAETQRAERDPFSDPAGAKAA